MCSLFHTGTSNQSPSSTQIIMEEPKDVEIDCIMGLHKTLKSEMREGSDLQRSKLSGEKVESQIVI